MATGIKDMRGFVDTDDGLFDAAITVRYTNDEIGETISLQLGGIMLGVPFEKIRPLIAEAKRKRK